MTEFNFGTESDPHLPHNAAEDADYPKSGRLLAVDYGTVRMGLAICDPDRILVSPYAVQQRGKREAEAKYFASLARDEKIAGFVVGLPIHCDGGESQKSVEAREFARWLNRVTQVPVRLFDERFSTAQAKRRLRNAPYTLKDRKARIDAIAAQVLLEAFIEVQAYTGQLPGQAIGEAAEGGESLD